jgi:pyroglutamyl-peptidase
MIAAAVKKGSSASMPTAPRAARGAVVPPGPVLLTGFEPFGGDELNPSWEVALRLAGERIGGRIVVAERLPCTFAGSLPALHRALHRHQPALVLALGLAASRSAIGIERVAINLIDARIADNAGHQPIDEPVLALGAPALFTRLPVKAIAAALQEGGYPAEVSLSAGSYVCNQVFYALMHRLAETPSVRGGFIHLPLLPQQGPGPGRGQALALDAQVDAVRLAIEVALTRGEDIATSAGRID